MSLQLVFSDDFEDGQLDPTWKYIEEWQTNVFTEANGVLSSDGTNTNWSALYVDKTFGGRIRQTVQINMSNAGTNKSAIVFIAKDDTYYYYVIFKWGAQKVEVQKVPIGNSDPAGSADDAGVNVSWNNAQMNTWQTIVVDYEPSTGSITITVDGTEVYSGTVDQLANKTPFAGIGIVKEVVAQFDNYSLEATQVGTPVTQVNILPVLSLAAVTVAPPSAPHFVIIDYTQSITVAPNSQFNVNVTVKNDGNAGGMVEVRLKDNQGVIVDSETVTLDSGEERQVVLTATAPSQEGTYTYTLEAYNKSTDELDDSKTVTVEVVSQQAVFRIVSYPQLIQVRAGEQFAITIYVANDGNVEGTVEVRIRDHNNNIVASTTRSIPPQSCAEISLTVTAPSQPGTYTWKIEAYNTDTQTVDDSKEFTLEVLEAAVVAAAAPSPWWIVAILIILILLLLLLRRRHELFMPRPLFA